MIGEGFVLVFDGSGEALLNIWTARCGIFLWSGNHCVGKFGVGGCRWASWDSYYYFSLLVVIRR